MPGVSFSPNSHLSQVTWTTIPPGFSSMLISQEILPRLHPKSGQDVVGCAPIPIKQACISVSLSCQMEPLIPCKYSLSGQAQRCSQAFRADISSAATATSSFTSSAQEFQEPTTAEKTSRMATPLALMPKYYQPPSDRRCRSGYHSVTMKHQRGYHPTCDRQSPSALWSAA